MNNWVFPHGENLTPRGVNDPAINSFLDNVIDSLTREVIQNSLDAKDGDSKNPVIVTFDFGSIKPIDIPGVNTIKSVAIPNSLNFWRKKGNSGTIEYLELFKKTLDKESLNILKISDYNTIGLDAKSYDALVIGNGYTEKPNQNAAGSKGIGKAAPFAISDLRLVFYNTVPKTDSTKHVGVLNFVSFNLNLENASDITQERAIYRDSELNYIPNQISFGFPERESTEYGTDLYIIGLREIDDDWEMRILLSSVNNFLVSILENKLVVRVNEKTLDKDSLVDIIELLDSFPMGLAEKKIFENTKNYLDALTHIDRKEFSLDNRFEKYKFIKSMEDGKLFLLKREPANRAILQTRLSGMKIYDRRSISGNINFTGVFRATGFEFDEFLRQLENTNHTDWSVDQAREKDRKVAKQLLKDLFDWFKESVKNSYEVAPEDIVDAFGLRDFLPLLSGSQGEEKVIDSGIKRSVETVELKRNNNKIQLTRDSDDQDSELEKLLTEVGFEFNEGENGFGADKKKKRRNFKDKLNLFNSIRKEKLVESTNLFSLKIVAKDTSQGKYLLLIKPQKDMKNIELDLKYIGEDGGATKAVILEAQSGTNKVKLHHSNIRVSKMKKDTIASIEVKIETKLLVKMSGVIYEVKV
ncbi:hypothetical protein ACTGZM_04265 [Streptococcus suis]